MRADLRLLRAGLLARLRALCALDPRALLRGRLRGRPLVIAHLRTPPRGDHHG